MSTPMEEDRTRITAMPNFPGEDPSPAAVAEGPLDDDWYLAVDGHQFGPMSFAELCSRVKRGEARSETGEEGFVWRDGFDDWLEVNNVPDLRPYAPPPPPPRSRTATGDRSAVGRAPESAQHQLGVTSTPESSAATAAAAHAAAEAAARTAYAEVVLPPAPVSDSGAASDDAAQRTTDSAVRSAAVLAGPESSSVTGVPSPAAEQERLASAELGAQLTAAKHLPSAFPDAPPLAQVPAGAAPANITQPMPNSIKVALVLGIIGAVTGVTLVVYFLFFDQRAQPEPVRIVHVGEPAKPAQPVVRQQPAATSLNSEPESDLEFAPVRVGRTKRGRKGRSNKKRAAAKASDTSKLTAEQRRLIALYRGRKGADLNLKSGSKRKKRKKGRDISRTELANVYKRHAAPLQACYNRALKRDDSLTELKAHVELTVGGSGIVKRVKLDAGDPMLTSCLKRNIKRWAFKPVGGEATISFPLIFRGS